MKHLDSIRHRTSAVATKTDSDLITSIELSRGSTCHLFPLHLDEWTDDQEGRYHGLDGYDCGRRFTRN